MILNPKVFNFQWFDDHLLSILFVIKKKNKKIDVKLSQFFCSLIILTCHKLFLKKLN